MNFNNSNYDRAGQSQEEQNQTGQGQFGQAGFVQAQKPAGKPKSPAKLIFTIVIILLIATAGALAFRVWDPVWNPFQPSPEKVIERMIERTKTLKSFSYDAYADYKATVENIDYSAALTLKGDVDGSDKDNPKMISNAGIVIDAEGMKISGEAQILGLGNEAYIRLTTIPFPFSMFIPSEIKDQWVKFINEDETLLKGKEEEVAQKMIDLFMNKKLWVLKEKVGSEKIKNTDTYHYIVVPNSEEVKKIIPEFLRILIDYIPDHIPSDLPSEQNSIENNLAEAVKEMDRFLETLGQIELEMWIGKRDYYLYQIKFEKTIDISRFFEDSPFGAPAQGRAEILAKVIFSNFNKPSVIEAPADFIMFDELLALIPGFIFPDNLMDDPATSDQWKEAVFPISGRGDFVDPGPIEDECQERFEYYMQGLDSSIEKYTWLAIHGFTECKLIESKVGRDFEECEGNFSSQGCSICKLLCR